MSNEIYRMSHVMTLLDMQYYLQQKAVLAGGSIDSPRPQNAVVPLKAVSLRSPKAARGFRMSADVSLSI
jgi:hypothetical protein